MYFLNLGVIGLTVLWKRFVECRSIQFETIIWQRSKIQNEALAKRMQYVGTTRLLRGTCCVRLAIALRASVTKIQLQFNIGQQRCMKLCQNAARSRLMRRWQTDEKTRLTPSPSSARSCKTSPKTPDGYRTWPATAELLLRRSTNE